MSTAALRTLRELDRCFATYGPQSSAAKLALLERLERASLARSAEVERFHEILCFLRAYPDDEALLSCVRRMLAGFERRADLRRHRAALEGTGIAGTSIRFPFFAPQARRLARLFPAHLSIDWPRFSGAGRLEHLLPLLTLPAERSAFDDPAVRARAWLGRWAGARGEAALLARGWDALACEENVRSAFYDDVDPMLCLSPGPSTPARAREHLSGLPVAFQQGPLSRTRPSLRDELRRRPEAVEPVSTRRARAIIELARDAMITRARDLEVFEYANPRDVLLVDAGHGFRLACMGVLPERRSVLEAVHAFVMLKNGVAVGYALCSALFRSSEVAYNVFETFRGGETAWMFGRLLATIHHLFGSDTFAIDPYQLGHGNDEGLRSGAFWFYQKLGFAPREPPIARLMQRELGRIRRTRGYRSSRSTLRSLSSVYAFWQPGRARNDVLGVLSPSNVALHVSRFVAQRYEGDRERARVDSLRLAAARLGMDASSLRRFTRSERQAWERWAPLLALLPGVERWPIADKRAAADIVRAKGAVRERDFAARFDRHRRLRRAVRRLAERPPE